MRFHQVLRSRKGLSQVYHSGQALQGPSDVVQNKGQGVPTPVVPEIFSAWS